MAVLGRVLVSSAERLDLPDFLSIDSYTQGDFKYLMKSFVGDDKPYVLKGFEVINPESSIGTQNITIKTAESVVYYPESLAGPFFHGLEEGNTLAQPLIPELRKNATNYVYLTCTTVDAANDTRAFWDPDKEAGEGGEFTQDVDTESVLTVDINVSVSSFPEDTIPVCIVKVGPNFVEEITDARDMMFRLASGGLNPDPLSTYSFRSEPEAGYERQEPNPTMTSALDPNPFRGGDKNIYSLKEWMDVVMTRLLELGGTTYWYEDTSTFSVVNIFKDALSTSIKSKGYWQSSDTTNGLLTWTEDITLQSIADSKDVIIRAGSKTLENNQVMYITQDRNNPINTGSVAVDWANGVDHVNGTLGSFENLQKGDWIKKADDDDYQYLRVEEFYAGANKSGGITAPGNALSIKLSETYGGTSETKQGIYTRGQYLSSDVAVADRDDPVLTAAGGNLYWLAVRSDTIVGASDITTTQVLVDIENHDGERARCTAVGHGLQDKQRITIAGSNNFDGTYQIEVETEDIFYIDISATPFYFTTYDQSINNASATYDSGPNEFILQSSSTPGAPGSYNDPARVGNKPILGIVGYDNNLLYDGVSTYGLPTIGAAIDHRGVDELGLSFNFGLDVLGDGSLITTGVITATLGGGTDIYGRTGAAASITSWDPAVDNVYIVGGLTGVVGGAWFSSPVTIADIYAVYPNAKVVSALATIEDTSQPFPAMKLDNGSEAGTIMEAFRAQIGDSNNLDDATTAVTSLTLDGVQHGVVAQSIFPDELGQSSYYATVTTTSISTDDGYELESATHGLEMDQRVIVSDTTNYNGSYNAFVLDSTSFTMPVPQMIASETSGTVTAIATYVRTDLGPTKIDQGENKGIGDVETQNIMSFIGMDNETQTSPTYHLPINYNTIDGFVNYNSETTDSLTQRVSQLTSMMADKAQDKTITHRLENTYAIVSSTNGSNQEITTFAKTATIPKLTFYQPSTEYKAEITLTGILSMGQNKAAYVTLDRNSDTSVPNLSALTVVDIDKLPIDENIFIFALRGDNDTVILWDRTPVRNYSTIIDDLESEVTTITFPNATSITTDEYFTINSALDLNEYYVWFNKDGAGTDPLVIGKIGVEIPIAAADSSGTIAAAVASTLGVITDFSVLDNLDGSITVSNVSTGYTTDAANVNVGGLSIVIDTQGSGAPLNYIADGDLLETAIKKLDQKLAEIAASVPQEAYEELITIVDSGGIGDDEILLENGETLLTEGGETIINEEDPVIPTGLIIEGPLPAGTILTLPPDSRNSNLIKSYTVGEGQLEVFLNGQYTNLGEDWTEVGTAGDESILFQIEQPVYPRDVLTLRLDNHSIGSGGTSGGGGTGEVNNGVNVGTGAAVFKDKSGTDLRFRTVVEGPGITVTQNADELVLSATPTAALKNVTTITGVNYGATSNDDVILVINSGTNVEVTLPSAVGITGKTYNVKKLDAGNIVSLKTSLGQTIDDVDATVGSFDIPAQYENITVVSDGANWWIL